MNAPEGKHGTCNRCAHDKTVYTVGGTEYSSPYELCWGCIDMCVGYGV